MSERNDFRFAFKVCMDFITYVFEHKLDNDDTVALFGQIRDGLAFAAADNSDTDLEAVLAYELQEA